MEQPTVQLFRLIIQNFATEEGDDFERKEKLVVVSDEFDARAKAEDWMNEEYDAFDSPIYTVEEVYEVDGYRILVGDRE